MPSGDLLTLLLTGSDMSLELSYKSVAINSPDLYGWLCAKNLVAHGEYILNCAALLVWDCIQNPKYNCDEEKNQG